MQAIQVLIRKVVVSEDFLVFNRTLFLSWCGIRINL